MPPRVLGSRVLVKPDQPDNTTDSGLVLPDDRDHVPVTGEVVALGPDGTESNYRARQQAIHEALAVLEDVERDYQHAEALQIARENIARLLGTSAEHDVLIGDRVVFPQECGLTMTVEGEDYIVLNADDVCVILHEGANAA